MADLRDLLDRMTGMAKRGIALNEMATANVIEMVEHIEDDDQRNRIYRRSCLELEHEQAQDAARAAANAVLDYLARHPEVLSSAGRSLLAMAQAARAKHEQLEESLLRRAEWPESGAV